MLVDAVGGRGEQRQVGGHASILARTVGYPVDVGNKTLLKVALVCYGAAIAVLVLAPRAPREDAH
ncbi:hypothetical protein GCM10009785_24840 [Brooklawnia cerclae]